MTQTTSARPALPSSAPRRRLRAPSSGHVSARVAPFVAALFLAFLAVSCAPAADEGDASSAAEEVGERPMAGDAGASGAAADAGAASGELVSEGGGYRLRYESAAEPMPINEIHEWRLHLETAEGAPVEGAAIEVSGDMPAHGHGLPTAPEVTEELGGGDYRLEGMKFQMGGAWEVYVSFETAEGDADRVTIPLELR